MSPTTADTGSADGRSAPRTRGAEPRHRKRFRFGLRRGADGRRGDEAAPEPRRAAAAHADRGQIAAPTPAPTAPASGTTPSDTAGAPAPEGAGTRAAGGTAQDDAPAATGGRPPEPRPAPASRTAGTPVGARVGTASGAHPVANPGAMASELLPAVLGSLAMRELALAESLIQLVESAERKEDDPDALAFLYRIDHLATRLRRSCENLLVLAGQDGNDPRLEPTPLLDVVRAAMSEIKHYDRVKIEALPRTAVVGLAADDLSHLLAELLDNAIAQSPREAPVVVRGRPGNGALIVMVDDAGIGIPAERLAELNARLASQVDLDVSVTRHMGLYVVSRLARRHGIYVQLQARPGNGTCVHIVVPHRLLQPMAPLRAPAAGHSGSETSERPTTRPGRRPASGTLAAISAAPVTRATPPRAAPPRPVPPIASAPTTVPGLPAIAGVPAARGETPAAGSEDDTKATRQDVAASRATTPDPKGATSPTGPTAPGAPGALPAPLARTSGGLPRRTATQRAPWQTAGFGVARPAQPVERTAEDAARYIHDQLDAFELGQHAALHDLTRRGTDEAGGGSTNPAGTEQT